MRYTLGHLLQKWKDNLTCSYLQATVRCLSTFSKVSFCNDHSSCNQKKLFSEKIWSDGTFLICRSYENKTRNLWNKNVSVLFSNEFG